MKQCNYGYYIIPIGENGEEAYEAIIPKFPKVHAFGDTLEELQDGVMAGIECAIEDLKKAGKPIPPEDKKSKFSGKILLRIDPGLHENIYRAAQANMTSLNKYIESKLR
ncbi:MAG: toxin-antitoxin system HicB family antitoxin [Candidatus Gracilibacteria bacterium]|jgi:predicted HicB family RNase H-like nuclease